MADLPLPEALIDTDAERLHWQLRPGNDRCNHADRVRVFTYLAALDSFRDESGHRVVWSAEEVADERVRLAEIANWHIDEVERQRARIEALEKEVEPLIEALTKLIDWLERGDAGHGRENYERFNADMLAARAALARVRGPEPDEDSDD